ncbi:MAG: hypothetical protein KUL88_17285, partial [Rhizobium sp.]|nr:hypothetical protein [Rhizobium sp.]
VAAACKSICHSVGWSAKLPEAKSRQAMAANAAKALFITMFLPKRLIHIKSRRKIHAMISV